MGMRSEWAQSVHGPYHISVVKKWPCDKCQEILNIPKGWFSHFSLRGDLLREDDTGDMPYHGCPGHPQYTDRNYDLLETL